MPAPVSPVGIRFLEENPAAGQHLNPTTSAKVRTLALISRRDFVRLSLAAGSAAAFGAAPPIGANPTIIAKIEDYLRTARTNSAEYPISAASSSSGVGLSLPGYKPLETRVPLISPLLHRH
jgi:hypothetical protein